jgi:SapC
MTNHAILNNVDHKNLRVATRHGADLGDDLMCTLAIPSEFRNIQADYPIFFHKNDDTGKYLPMVMFGLQQGENLYLNEGQWQASYIPLMIQRGPFLIGFQSVMDNNVASKKMVISIDMDNPRVGGDEGEPVFQPFGGNSEYTERVISVLQQIDDGQAVIEELQAALIEHQLLEPFSLDVELNNGVKHSLQGFHAIHEERLTALDGDVLADLSQRGILQAVYMVVASMSKIRRLIELKNGRL